MDLIKTSIRRPIALLMCVLIVIGMGFVSFSNLSIDLMPQIDFPMIIIMTTYGTTGPYEIESMITKPIESAVAAVQNVTEVTSSSSQGVSLVMVEFENGTDMNYASLRVRERIDLIKAYLPDAADTPTVLKLNLDSMPIAIMAVRADMDSAKLYETVDDSFSPRFERLDGVASVTLVGGDQREIQVRLDPQKLAGYGLSINQIQGVLASENLNLPQGDVDYGDKTLTLRSIGEFKSISDIERIPLNLPTGGTVRLSDIADVVDTYKDKDAIARVNGESAILLAVQKSSDGNTLTTAQRVREEIEKLAGEYPNISIDMLSDQSEYIEYSISNVGQNLILGALLAVLVLVLFLKNLSMPFVISLSIPISVIATFVMIYFSGTTLNMLSLGGLTLGVGMLVDNSIVVLENIYRFRTQGLDSEHASYRGAKEVFSAITASTLTTIVVFVPIAFTSGIAVQIFKDMALTVICSLTASLVVAVTVVPALCSKLPGNAGAFDTAADEGEETLPAAQGGTSAAGKKSIKDRFVARWDSVLKGLDRAYRRLLGTVMNHKGLTVLVAVACFAAAIFMMTIVGIELMPSTDEGMISVSIEMPTGAKLEEMSDMSLIAEEYIASLDEVDIVASNIGSGYSLMSSGNTISLTCRLVAKDMRARSTDEVADDIRERLTGIPGADISVSSQSSIMGGSGSLSSDVSYEIYGDDMDALEQLADAFVAEMKQVDGVAETSTSITEGSPEIQLYIDRGKAASYGLTAAQVAASVRTTLQGVVATTLKLNGDEIDVRLKFPDDVSESVERLKMLTVTSPTGAPIPLAAMTDIVQEQSLGSITRSNQQRYVSVDASVSGRDVNSVRRDMEKRFAGIRLPDGYSYTTGGMLEMLDDSIQSMLKLILFAVLLVYMVMAAQFESLLYPFVIMFSIPLAATGSFLALSLTNTTLSLPGFIGFVVLVGIVVNNAIVLVDYINILRREERLDVKEAVLRAGPTRLRPILMTAMTTILGLLPMILSAGEGAEIERPLGLVVAGGLLSSTLLTLIVVPVLYIIFDSIAGKAKAKFKKKSAATDISVTAEVSE